MEWFNSIPILQEGFTLFPETIIVVHPNERRSKCSVEPLRGKEGFTFWTYPHKQPEQLTGYVRLGIGGELISPEDATKGLVVLDGTWRWAEKMEQQYQELPIRSLPNWVTAYPRVSKVYADPQGGLATVEAIYAAYVGLGRNVDGMLDSYYWKEKFLELNAERLAGNV
ncbi:ribosome biogenesis domain-containing protein [Lacunimicrobium album]